MMRETIHFFGLWIITMMIVDLISEVFQSAKLCQDNHILVDECSVRISTIFQRSSVEHTLNEQHIL